MNVTKRQRAALLVPIGLVLAMVTAVAVWLQGGAAVSAGSPPPDLPAFEGEPFTAVLKDATQLNQEAIFVPEGGGTWTAVLSETFESGIDPGVWTAVDQDGLTNGEYYWGTETYTNTTPGGTRSAWAVGAGEDGGPLDPATDGYPTHVDSWLIYGPVNLANATEAVLSFNYWLHADAGDGFAVAASLDGVNYSGLQQNNGGPGGWFGSSYALDNTYLGDNSVYLAFLFTSDATGSAKRGAFLDDVLLSIRQLERAYLPAVMLQPPPPAPSPTPSPTPGPGGGYFLEHFDVDDGAWKMRRTDDDDDYDIAYRSEGHLQLIVNGPEDYVIASPMVAAPSTPYKIETYAVIKDPKDQHAYGVIFGADWNGAPCPNAGYTSCFNHYYWLRVQWRANNNNPVLEFKLKRVDGHDANNEAIGPDLIGWTSLPNADVGGWNEWDIRVESDGGIKIYLADVEVGRVNDSTYIDDPYFGVIVSTKANGGGRAKFDYYEVEPQ